jgi:hypothetical protein
MHLDHQQMGVINKHVKVSNDKTAIGLKNNLGKTHHFGVGLQKGSQPCRLARIRGRRADVHSQELYVLSIGVFWVI